MTTRRGPSRAASRGATPRAKGIIISAMGSRLSAPTSALSPFTSCRYCRTMKTKPKKAKNWRVIVRAPAENARMRNSRGSSSGFGRLSSHRTNPARMTTAAARPSSVRGLPQPSTGASMIE